jgi:hypothetical protein
MNRASQLRPRTLFLLATITLACSPSGQTQPIQSQTASSFIRLRIQQSSLQYFKVPRAWCQDSPQGPRRPCLYKEKQFDISYEVTQNCALLSGDGHFRRETSTRRASGNAEGKVFEGELSSAELSEFSPLVSSLAREPIASKSPAYVLDDVLLPKTRLSVDVVRSDGVQEIVVDKPEQSQMVESLKLLLKQFKKLENLKATGQLGLSPNGCQMLPRDMSGP